MKQFKKITILAILATLFALCLTFAACGHVHSPATEWSSDDTHHWKACTDTNCTEVSQKAEHTWEYSVVGTTQTATCSVCGKSVDKENYLLTATFVTDGNASVTVFEKQDFSGDGTDITAENNTANARDKEGNLLSDGEGQVNFKVIVKGGYVLDSIVITNTDGSDNVYYKNFKAGADIGIVGGYRITKICGNVTITISTKAVTEVQAYTVNVVTDEHSDVIVSFDNGNACYSRDGDTGALLTTGGEFNFVVVPSKGYIVDEITIANADSSEGKQYNKLKTALDDKDFSAFQYRVTKITGNIVVNITTKQAPFEAKFEFVDADGKKIADAGKVIVYATQDYTAGGTELSHNGVAVATSSDTGLPDNSGEGQVNFTVVLADGYTLVSVTATSGAYKNIKTPANTGKDNTYRVTKIQADLVVTITVSVDSEE